MTVFTRAGCFLSGTMLLTNLGERRVETLVPGDELVAIRADGPALQRISRITAIHRRLPGEEALYRIGANAFAPQMPMRDLTLFGEHAIYADGALFELRDLCNDMTIIREVPRVLTGYVVELDAHDLVLAEGLPVESSPGASGQAVEAAGPNIIALYPAWAPAERQGCCLPVSRDGTLLLALRRMLAHRAGVRRQVSAK